MIEENLREYIEAGVVAAFPGIKSKQVLVRFAQGSMVYDRNKSRACIGSETLTAEIVIETDSPLERRAFLRAFPRKTLELDGDNVFQEYRRHIAHDYLEAAQLKGASFFVDYTYDIFEG